MKNVTKFITLIFAALLACAPASAQTTKPVDFFLGAWQVPETDVAKWQGRGVNTFVGHVDLGGAMTKAEWERRVGLRGGRFFTYPGADVAAEAKQPARAGFMQLDEPDLSNHVDKPGYTPAALDALYQKTKATGLPLLITMGAMDNEWYDGFPKPGKIDGSKYGHRAASGGWLAYADICGFDFYIYTHGRTSAQFNVIERLLDRSSVWSGGKPVYLFIESCTQGKTGADGKPNPMTADQWEEQVWHAVNYCKAKGYKLNGIIYFSHQVFPNWKAFDITPPEIDARMRVVNPKVLAMFNAPATPPPTTLPTPQPDPAIAALQAKVDEQAKALAAVQERQKAIDEWVRSFPTSQPANKQPNP